MVTVPVLPVGMLTLTAVTGTGLLLVRLLGLTLVMAASWWPRAPSVTGAWWSWGSMSSLLLVDVESGGLRSGCVGPPARRDGVAH